MAKGKTKPFSFANLLKLKTFRKVKAEGEIKPFNPIHSFAFGGTRGEESGRTKAPKLTFIAKNYQMTFSCGKKLRNPPPFFFCQKAFWLENSAYLNSTVIIGKGNSG